MEQKQKSQIIHDALGTMPEKYRIILSLRDMQGFAYEDISRILNLSPGTVDSRLHRARKMLRAKVRLHMEGEEGGS
jgi:RNA polymerase sigma-70 factor (ECF subfamily)